ncbi:MAG: SDR family NAD(P)-dependent oxidoreductase, partial [Sphingobium sp.]
NREYGMSLQGKVAVVTGGANGIGAAISRRLRQDGATVAIVDVTEPDLAEFRAIEGVGEIEFFPCDVSAGPAIETCAQTILERFGPVAIIVNNAGGSGKVVARTVEENSDEIWHHVMDLNVTSIVRFCRHFVPGMRENKYGRIINMSSAVRHGIPGPFVTMKSHLAYVVAKGAMATLTTQLAKDLGNDGITCNAIAPGLILPDPDARITKIVESEPKEVQDAILRGIPAGRFGNGNDIAAVAAFLASEESSYVSGQTIDVKGG